jgi:cellobiose-specific phosphotransferase system component IIB
MKKVIFILALTTTLLTGIIFMAYRSSYQKNEDAEAILLFAKHNLSAAQKETFAVEWKTFKSESELKIKLHEIVMTELSAKMEKHGVKPDSLYEIKAAYLAPQIRYMKARLENYDKAPSNWETFKHGFNHEMDEIEIALEDLTTDDKSKF